MLLFCILLLFVQVYRCAEVFVGLRYPLSEYEFRVGLSVIVRGADSVQIKLGYEFMNFDSLFYTNT